MRCISPKSFHFNRVRISVRKRTYCYLPRTTAKISHCFRCYFAAGDPKGEDFRGDGEKPGCFFAAFNSDISERCSILHTSRKVGLVAHGSGHRPARRQGSGKAIVDQPAAVSPKGRFIAPIIATITLTIEHRQSSDE